MDESRISKWKGLFFFFFLKLFVQLVDGKSSKQHVRMNTENILYSDLY